MNISNNDKSAQLQLSSIEEEKEGFVREAGWSHRSLGEYVVGKSGSKSGARMKVLNKKPKISP